MRGQVSSSISESGLGEMGFLKLKLPNRNRTPHQMPRPRLQRLPRAAACPPRLPQTRRSPTQAEEHHRGARRPELPAVPPRVAVIGPRDQPGRRRLSRRNQAGLDVTNIEGQERVLGGRGGQVQILARRCIMKIDLR